MLPEEKARVKIDAKLNKAGWYVFDRDDVGEVGTINE